MSRSGRNYGKKPPDIGLQMECHDEALSPEQAAAYNKGEKEFKEVTAKLEQMMKNLGGEIIEKGDSVYVIQMTTSPPVPVPTLTPTTPVGKAAPSPASRQTASLIAQPSPVSNPMVQAIQTATGPVILQAQSMQTRSTVNTRTNMRMTTPNQKTVINQPSKLNIISPPTPTVPSIRIKTPKPPPSQKNNANIKTTAPAGKALPNSSNRPTESNSVGGLSTGPGSKPWRPATSGTGTATATGTGSGTATGTGSGSGSPAVSAPVVDLTDDDGKPSSPTVADSREVTFNKLSGKTFPSLVVVARPNLRIKDIPQGTVSQERSVLDAKVKSVLMFTPTKFTEWLIQQGLVRSEQYCTTHVMPDNTTPIKLKLGMYSDVSKFPYSGGYVWISECCPQRFVSVFSGSVFEGAPHPPTVLLKLIYHWACQTNVQNVVQWVKVDNFYVKNFFTNMRSVCTAAIHEKYEKMGGVRKRVEVGVISLGTTSQDGNMRQVKVEVLGVMDPENKLIRLRAVEPLQQEGERNYKRRFVKILEPLEQWVDKESIILTDFTVDKGTLHNMGFTSVYQVSITDTPTQQNKYSNHNVMEYLRRIVPRMFQNTLSLLSRQIIQQFLDELVWRERWGPVASQAFDNVIAHMSEQTKLETGDSLLTRLSKVAANPFKLWQYSTWKTPPTPKTPIVTNGTTTSTPPPPPPPTTTTTTQPQPPTQSEPLPPPGPISSIDMLPQSIRTVDPPLTTPTPKRSRKRAAGAADAPEAKRSATATPPLIINCPPEEQIALDSYYYGTLEGDAEIIKEEFKNTLAVKCCVCHRKISNNIALMKHLIMHAQSENQFSTELSDLTQCKYCHKSFPTPFLMQTHIEEIHLKASTSLVCRICEEKFRDRPMLIAHMHRTHAAIELPYECGICKFRSSMHRDLIDHFYDVHIGGEKMQCPFCLKTVAFASSGKRMSPNVNFFLKHIQKHQRKSIARKCHKCALWFVHKGILKEHEIKDHSSFKGIPGVKPYVNPSGVDIMMPPPPTGQVKNPYPLKKQPDRFKSTSFANKTFEPGLAIYGVQTGATCCECEGEFLGEEHFPGYLTCSKCRFATCCSKAMTEHIVVFHESGKSTPEFTLGRTIQLPTDMHCVCGYRTSSGNRLANHLAKCERKSAYPSVASAKAATIQSASFPPLVTLDDADNAGEDPSDRWLKAFVPSRKEDPGEGSRDAPEKKQSTQSEGGDPPSMLNILGLVRKPSTDESSLDRALSDSEGLPDSKVEQPQTAATSEKEPNKEEQEPKEKEQESNKEKEQESNKEKEQESNKEKEQEPDKVEEQEPDKEEEQEPDEEEQDPDKEDDQENALSGKDQGETVETAEEKMDVDETETRSDQPAAPMETDDAADGATPEETGTSVDDRMSPIETEENSQTSETEKNSLPSPQPPVTDVETRVPSPTACSESRSSAPTGDIDESATSENEPSAVVKDSEENEGDLCTASDDQAEEDARLSPINENETAKDQVADSDVPTLGDSSELENVDASTAENAVSLLEENAVSPVEENVVPSLEENATSLLEENAVSSEEKAVSAAGENAASKVEDSATSSIPEAQTEGEKQETEQMPASVTN